MATSIARVLSSVSESSLIEALLARHNYSASQLFESVGEQVPAVLESVKVRLDAEKKLSTRFKVLFVEHFRKANGASLPSGAFENTIKLQYAENFLGGVSAETLTLTDEHYKQFMSDNAASSRGDTSRAKRRIEALSKGDTLAVAEMDSEPTMETAFLVSRGPAGTSVRDTSYMNPKSKVSLELAAEYEALEVVEEEIVEEPLASDDSDDSTEELGA